jgi:hypothetical protein
LEKDLALVKYIIKLKNKTCHLHIDPIDPIINMLGSKNLSIGSTIHLVGTTKRSIISSKEFKRKQKVILF